MTAAPPVLIAGGGIAGLALAVALARLGRPSVVLERQPKPAAAGAGIQLGPNAVHALRSLGVAQALEPLAGVPEAIEVRAGASGRRLARLPLGRWITARHGAAYWVAHRGDLFSVLWEAANASKLIEIHTGAEVAAVAGTADEIAVASTNGRRFSGAILVGADGLWSAVRRTISPDAAPRPAGATATRTVIPAEQAGPLAANAVGAWLTPSAHVVHYPVRGGSEIAVVVIAREAGAGPERNGSSRGWDIEVDGERLQRRLAAFDASLAKILMPGGAMAWPWREWRLHALPPLQTWTQERVVLIGDAAHPMLPYLAQGGALALEDAVVLAACIHSAGADPAAALQSFERLRTARARRVQAASLRQGRIYHLPPPLAWARDAVLSSAPPRRLMAGYDWLYSWRPPLAPDPAGLTP